MCASEGNRGKAREGAVKCRFRRSVPDLAYGIFQMRGPDKLFAAQAAIEFSRVRSARYRVK